MLIAVTRDRFPGLLMQGVCQGVHWRAVRDMCTYRIEGPHNVFTVYLQFLIDVRMFNIANEREFINDLPVRYNSETVGRASNYLHLPPSWRGQSSAHHKLQWAEMYYGNLRLSERSGKYVGASMFAAWYPRRRNLRHVDVLPITFKKYVQPSAEYMCAYFSLVAEGHQLAGGVSVDHS